MRRFLLRQRSSWLRATACLFLGLLFGDARIGRSAARPEGDIRAIELSALDSAHAQLAAIMDVPANAQSMRDGLRGIRHVLLPARGNLREDARAQTTELEQRVSAALAQLGDGGAALTADRSEFVLSALVPIAIALDDTRATLGERAP